MPYRSPIAQLQTKVTQTILAASAFLFVVIIVNDSLLGLYLPAAIKVPMLLLFLWGWYNLRRNGFKERNTHVVLIPVLLFFAVNFVTNQGTNGPTLAAITTMFVVYPILLSRTIQWIYSGVTLALIAFLLWIGIDQGRLYRATYNSPEEQFLDHLTTHIAVGIYLTILVGVVINFYRNQNAELEKARLGLTAQVERTEAEKLLKEELLGILAHDVKGPVINLRQLIQLQERGNLGEEALRGLMKSVELRLSDLLSTVDNVLSQTKAGFYRAESDAPVNPEAFTHLLVDSIRYRLEAKNQALEVSNEVPSEVSFDSAIAAEVSIILKNLIDNAIKYSPENSAIRVKLAQTKAGICWEVHDQGTGIPEKLLASLFSKAITSSEGTGIGLYLCKSIADRIGADLWFESSDIGSTFFLAVKPRPAT
ncbi:MAG: sensor histidine kinase [Flavobacteriales bacterium]